MLPTDDPKDIEDLLNRETCDGPGTDDFDNLPAGDFLGEDSDG